MTSGVSPSFLIVILKGVRITAREAALDICKRPYLALTIPGPILSAHILLSPLGTAGKREGSGRIDTNAHSYG
jgi:hypothetical protein